MLKQLSPRNEGRDTNHDYLNSLNCSLNELIWPLHVKISNLSQKNEFCSGVLIFQEYQAQVQIRVPSYIFLVHGYNN